MYLYNGETVEKFEELLNQQALEGKNGTNSGEVLGFGGLEYGFDPDMGKNITAQMPYAKAEQEVECENLTESIVNNHPISYVSSEYRMEISKMPPSLPQPQLIRMSDSDISFEEHIDLLDLDINYAQNLMNDIAKSLYPYVTEVLNEYDYEDSPVFNYTIDREFINQLVDTVLDKAAVNIYECKNIHTEMDRASWNRYRLLRSNCEQMLLNELFCSRRVKYRIVCGKRGCY